MKKHTLLFLLVALGINLVFADCSSSGMQFYPQEQEISMNSIFIIEGYALSQETINSFKNRIIYLESENDDLIQLSLEEILIGQMELTQAIFCPTEELKPNTKYFLKYSNQTEREGNNMMRFNRDKDEFEKIYWRTTESKSKPHINPKLKIDFEKSEVVYYGCGPSANAIFNVNNVAETEVWYRTEVTEIDTNKKHVYYIIDCDGNLNVGHGMCSGAFIFNPKSKYKVRFTPINTDGKSLGTTDWILFKNPFQNDKN